MKIISALLVAALAVTSLHAEPKKLLVVTTTTGFRHSSIPTLEKVLTQLGKDSGAFTVDLVQQPPGQPAALRGNATDEQKAAYNEARLKWNAALKAGWMTPRGFGLRQPSAAFPPEGGRAKR